MISPPSSLPNFFSLIFSGHPLKEAILPRGYLLPVPPSLTRLRQDSLFLSPFFFSQVFRRLSPPHVAPLFLKIARSSFFRHCPIQAYEDPTVTISRVSILLQLATPLSTSFPFSSARDSVLLGPKFPVRIAIQNHKRIDLFFPIGSSGSAFSLMLVDAFPTKCLPSLPFLTPCLSCVPTSSSLP